MQTNTLILMQSFLIISNIWAATGQFSPAIVWFIAAVLVYVLAYFQRGSEYPSRKLDYE